MKYFSVILLVTCSILNSNSAFGQAKTDGPWSLEECIAHAFEQNLSLQDQALVRDRQKVALEQSKMARYPNLNSSLGHNYNFGRAIDPFTNQFVNQSIQSNNFNLSSSVTLYNALRIKNTITLNELLLEKGHSDIDANKNQLIRNVTIAYLNIISASQNLKTAQQQDSTTKTQIERVERLVKGGRLNRGELLNLKAQNSNDLLAIQRAEGSVKSAYLNMRQLIQVAPSVNFEIQIPVVLDVWNFKTDDMEEVVQRSIDELPSMRSANQLKQIRQLNEQIAKAGLQPRVSLFANLNSVYSQSRKETFNERPKIVEIGYVEGSGTTVLRDAFDYDTRTTPFGNQLSDNFGQSAGLSVTVPIFNNHQVKSQIANAEIGIEQAEVFISTVKNTIRSDIWTAYNDLSNSLASYKAAKASEEAQKENYSFTEKRFNNGLITSAELIMARNNWRQSQIELQRAQYQLMFSQSTVHFYRTGEIRLN